MGRAKIGYELVKSSVLFCPHVKPPPKLFIIRTEIPARLSGTKLTSGRQRGRIRESGFFEKDARIKQSEEDTSCFCH